MTVLITGAAGLLGTELTRQLLAQGEDIVAVDNFTTGSRNNTKEFQGKNNYWPLDQDVRKKFQVPCPKGPFSPLKQIYNLACPASPIHYQKDPWNTLMTNIEGVSNMLEVAEQKGLRMLQASTSEVYGDPLENPQNENYWGNVNTIGPRACYDEGKRVAETMCTISSADTVIARIFNTYGPHMALNDGRAISNFILQALENKPITVHGDGLQTRSFCYVSDTVSGLIKLMNSDSQGPINIGNTEEVTLLQLAQEVIELADSKSEIIHTDSAVDDPHQRCPDIYQAISKLNWLPNIDRKTGLKYTIDYVRTQLCEQ